MYKSIVSILDNKYSVIIAFIPILNILYLLFRLFFVRSISAKVPMLQIAIVGIPFVILYNVIPDSWGWTVTHLLLSCITALFMHKSRGCYSENISFNSNMMWIALFVAIMATGVYVAHIMKPTLAGVDNQKIYAAVQAIVDNDEEAWTKLVHPEYGDDIKSLIAVKRTLDLNEVNLESGFYYRTSRSDTIYHYSVTDGEAVGIETYIYSNDSNHAYLVNAVWQESKNASGFIVFEITS